MTAEEAIKIIKIAIAEIERNCPLDYAEAMRKIKEDEAWKG